MERRLAAILAADVAGYTHLVEVNDEASTATLRSYVAVMEEAIVVHRGHIFSTAGDSVVAEFPSIVQAIRCAVEIQHEIADRNEAVPDDKRMAFRIGINLGDVIAEENALYGTGINVAARLEQLAEPGGICVSQTVYDQVRKIVEMSFQDLGAVRLKNIAEPVRVYRVLQRPIPRSKKRLSITRGRILFGTTAGVTSLLAVASIYFDPASAHWPSLLSMKSQVGTDRPSIAVLPFRNMSAKSDEDYFTDGLTQDITSELTRFKNLFVIASNSAFTYKNRPVSAQDIGKDLGVEYLLEGTIQRDNMRVRLTTQLINAKSGWQIWGNRYDQDGNDIFDIQDKIITAVTTRLNVELNTAELKQIMISPTSDASAYDRYLKGRQAFYTYTHDGNDAAKHEFSEAIRLDPNFAQAYGWLAYVYLTEVQEGWSTDVQSNLTLARDLASKGVSLAPDDYYTHWNMASIFAGRKEMSRAAEEYNKALLLNPNDADLLADMADMLSYQGEPDRAVAQIERAKQLNPRYPDWYNWSLGFAYFQSREYADAVAALEKMTDAPNTAYVLLAACKAKLGRPIPRDEITQRLLSKDPQWTSDHLEQFPFVRPEDQKHYVEALQAAGVF